MSYTPFERELLKKVDKTNELLELVVMGLTPVRIVTGMKPSPEQVVRTLVEQTEDKILTREEVEALGKSHLEALAKAAGLQPVSQRGTPPTPEERQARWAARAQEVGHSPEQAEQFAAKAQLDLDNLVEKPAKKPPAKRAAK